jgi:hypothetical protein
VLGVVARVIRVDQLFLGAEVVVRVPGGYPGLFGDGPHGGGLVAVLAEQPQRRLRDRLEGLLALAAPPPRPFGLRRRVEFGRVELVDGVHVRWHGRHGIVTVSVRGRHCRGRSFNRNLNAFKAGPG